MSVHKEIRPNGTVVFKVRWTQAGRQRGKTFNPGRLGGPRAARRLAEQWDTRMAEMAATGDFAALTRGTITVREYAERWWDAYASPRLAPSTQTSYADLLDRVIIPRFGDWQLRDLQPADIDAWIAAMARAGLGAPTIRRAAFVLQGILKRAVRDRELESNPVAQVDKPRSPRRRKPIIVAPAGVEAIRAHLLAREQLGDATLVGFLAYAGPRPESEGITLKWPAVGRRAITITSSKKHGAQRTFQMLPPLAEDLHEWRRAAGHRVHGLVFPFAGGHVAPEGRPWSPSDWDNWRGRVFRPAAKAAGLPPGLRPRDLRNSLASLLIWEGRNYVEVARILGHTPSVCIDKYAGVLEEFEPEDRKPADQAIRDARQGVGETRRRLAL